MPPGALEDWSLGRRMSSDSLGAHRAVGVLSRMVVLFLRRLVALTTHLGSSFPEGTGMQGTPPSWDALAGEEVGCWGHQQVHWSLCPEQGQPRSQATAPRVHRFLAVILVALPLRALVFPTVMQMSRRVVLLGWVASKSIF